MSTTTVVDIETTRRLHRVRQRLEREAQDYRDAGFTDRAEAAEAEVEELDARIREQDEARREAKSRSRERDAEQRKKHEAEMKARQAAAERREAAREWFEGRQGHSGPVPVVQALREASVAGFRADDVLAGVVRVRRQGAEFLALPGTYRRRDFIPVSGA